MNPCKESGHSESATNASLQLGQPAAPVSAQRRAWEDRFEMRKVGDLKPGQIVWKEASYLVFYVKAMGLKFPYNERKAEDMHIPYIVLPPRAGESGTSARLRIVAKLCSRRRGNVGSGAKEANP